MGDKSEAAWHGRDADLEKLKSPEYAARLAALLDKYTPEPDPTPLDKYLDQKYSRILVIAGTYSQANNWRRDHGLHPNDIMYVPNYSRLMGFPTGSWYVLVGTWDHRPYQEMMPILYACRARYLRRAEDDLNVEVDHPR